ncbi:SURF1 family protein [Chloroflexales bacterium ZM16-3]|nr:SURF1 family protein [Chloroflexales bacterium ZM16-3]
MKHPLLRPSWLIRHAFALLIFITMIGLGIWQLDRLGQRRAANAARQAVLDQSPVALSGDPDAGLALVGRRVRASGTYLNAQSVILRGQKSDSGVDGVHLLTPLQLSGGDVAVIVDRGWLPAGQAAPEARGAFAIDREVTVEGVALIGQSRPDALLASMDLAMPGETRIDAWLRVDIGKMQAQIDAPLLPVYIEQLPSAAGPRLPLPADPRKLDEGPHLSYALQWFAFSVILAVVYAGLMRQELRRIGRAG